MLDNDTDGKVDRVQAVFSESLSSYSAGTVPWTLANVPSGGALSSVSVSSATATLTVAEGAGAANTAVGTFTVTLATSATGVRDSSGNLASFTATAPADKAGPAVTALTSSGGTRGKLEPGDQLVVTFSEPLLASTVPASTTVSERDPSGSGSDVLNIAGITDGDQDTASNNYIVTSSATASFASSTVSLATSTVTVTVGSTCAGSACAGISTSQGDLDFSPATTITDAAGNPATGTLTMPGTFQLF
jgi:hypothetical protein